MRRARQTRAVAHSFERISRESLWQKVERGDDFVLVDALAPISYTASHLPGAISMPPEYVAGRARGYIPSHDTEVVVYCASEDCETSLEVANQLSQLGYRNIRHYAGGKRDWAKAGLPLEGSGVRRVSPQL
jgi:rhodanese-related sulfurtransferase